MKNVKKEALAKKMKSGLRPYTKADFRRDNPTAKDMPKGVNAIENVIRHGGIKRGGVPENNFSKSDNS